ncbi:hypothetical protein [Streptomyces sp. WMMC905]|uniref:hypothetical protein n=1 Tax=Streptomyces sp. WMMC905 TaxID=3404123 RepID=UPI003B965683
MPKSPLPSIALLKDCIAATYVRSSPEDGPLDLVEVPSWPLTLDQFNLERAVQGFGQGSSMN